MNEEFQGEKLAGSKNIISDDRLSLEFMKLDLASLKSTKAFIDAFISSGRKLHLLICNAGAHSHSEGGWTIKPCTGSTIYYYYISGTYVMVTTFS